MAILNYSDIGLIDCYNHIKAGKWAIMYNLNRSTYIYF